jgi:hypothetical protein
VETKIDWDTTYLDTTVSGIKICWIVVWSGCCADFQVPKVVLSVLD